MGFCSCTSKFVIVIINLFFWLGAALLIAAGVTFLTRADGIVDDVDHKPAYITFGIAALLFLCGLVGIAGAFSEKKFLLGIFSVVVLATLILLVFVSATLFVKHDNAMNETDNFLLKQFNNYGDPNLTVALTFDDETFEMTTSPGSGSGNASTTTPSSANTTTPSSSDTTTVVTTVPTTPKPDMNATDFIDSVQDNLHCCGFNNYTDWYSFDYWTKTLENKGYVPGSCCNQTAADAKNTTCPDHKIHIKKQRGLIYTKGCQSEVDTIVNMVYKFMNWTAVAFAILVLLGFCASIYLMCRKRSSDGFNYSSIVA